MYENNDSHDTLHLVLPSDGELYDSTLDFLKDCGLGVRRPSARRYTAYVPALPGIEVLFQRTADITRKVEEGSAEIGITGLDRLLEYRSDEHAVVPLVEDLGYGRCEFVLAVPNAWLDVTSVDDLADLALEFHEKGSRLRIASKYPRLLRQYLFDRGINYFTIVAASGALEAAPTAGYADLIADITATGATLRENRLKTLEGGTVLSSQSCVIGNPAQLALSPARSRLARPLDRVDRSPPSGRALLPPYRQRRRTIARGCQRHHPGPPPRFLGCVVPPSLASTTSRRRTGTASAFSSVRAS